MTADETADEPRARLSRKKQAIAVDPIYVDLPTFSALFMVSDGIAKSWVRRGLITPVHLPSTPGSKREPLRFYFPDVLDLGRRFKAERAS